MRESKGITPEELKDKYNLKVGDILEFKNPLYKDGFTLLAYHVPSGLIIGVYLQGNYAANLCDLRHVLDTYGEYEITRFKRNRLSI